MDARQALPSLTGAASPTSTLSPASVVTASLCATTILPADGILSLQALTTTLAAPALYMAACTNTPDSALVAGGAEDSGTLSAGSDSVGMSDFRDPFYASIFPQCYALAACTVLAYVLFFMLIVVPRSFLDGGVVVLGRRGFTNGPNNGVDIGGRPWLQKVAALLVAISLTIATANTFRVAEIQYTLGTQNATELQQEVLGGTELKVIQLISDTFLWLAQAQTLIRLFPRQREKVIIKWTAFSLITLDTIFEGLNSFYYTSQGQVRPHNFTDAVPALSYLFELSLNLLYAAWVIYYSLMKKRYAFYHPLMKNICLMAFLSIISILVPVVFFILDIAEPEFTGWGDYVRWVGAAAASVVVWEWVERIEALEREEKKDGILGREVFDGDEMIGMTSSDLSWPRRRKGKKRDDSNGSDDGGESGHSSNLDPDVAAAQDRKKMWPAMSSIATRYKAQSSGVQTSGSAARAQAPAANHTGSRLLQPPLWLSRPQPAVTPVSRTDTASADSTVYAVRYQALTDTTMSTDGRAEQPSTQSESTTSPVATEAPEPTFNPAEQPTEQKQPTETQSADPGSASRSRWGHMKRINPFSNQSNDPPAEIVQHIKPKEPRKQRSREDLGARWNVRERMEEYAAARAERIRERVRATNGPEDLPVTVIPAPPRRGAALAQLLEEDENDLSRGASASTHQEAHLAEVSRQISRGDSNPFQDSSHSSLGEPLTGTASRTNPGSTDQAAVSGRAGLQDSAALAPTPSHERRAVDDIARTSSPP